MLLGGRKKNKTIIVIYHIIDTLASITWIIWQNKDIDKCCLSFLFSVSCSFIVCLSDRSLAGTLFIFLIFFQCIVNLLLVRSCGRYFHHFTGGNMENAPLLKFALRQNIWTEYLYQVTSVIRFRNTLIIHRSNIKIPQVYNECDIGVTTCVSCLKQYILHKSNDTDDV